MSGLVRSMRPWASIRCWSFPHCGLRRTLPGHDQASCFARSHRLLSDRRLVIASHNAGKAREIAELMAPFGVEVISAHRSNCRNRRRPKRHSSAMRNSNRAPQLRHRASGIGRRFRARGPRARRPRPHLFGALGGADEGFLHRHGEGTARIGDRERHRPARALRSRALSVLAGRPL